MQIKIGFYKITILAVMFFGMFGNITCGYPLDDLLRNIPDRFVSLERFPISFDRQAQLMQKMSQGILFPIARESVEGGTNFCMLYSNGTILTFNMESRYRRPQF